MKTIYTWFAGVLVCGFLLHAEAISTDSLAARQERIEEQIDEAMNQKGVWFDIEATSEFSSPDFHRKHVSLDSATRETEAFTSVDLGIEARTTKRLCVQSVIRLNSDWNSMWGNPIDLVTLRWISLDGLLADWLSVHLGDHRTKYTPYTLAAPGLEICGEPEVLRYRRTREEREYYVNNGYRPLQGLVSDLHFEIGERISLGANVQFDRLHGVNTTTSKYFQDMAYDRFAFGLRPVFRYGRSSGMTVQLVDVRDWKGSASTESTQSGPNKSALRNTVYGGVLSLGLTDFVEKTTVNRALITAEFDHAEWDEESGETQTPGVSGNILDIGFDMDLTYSFVPNLKVNYVQVGKEYRALLSQAPVYLWAMSDKYLLCTNYDRPNHFASGLYYSNFGRQATAYNDAPAYLYGRHEPQNNIHLLADTVISIYDRDDLRDYFTNDALDPISPLGPGTPDRKGVIVEVGESFADSLVSFRAKASVLGNSMNAKLNQLGIGARVKFDLKPERFQLPYLIDLGYTIQNVNGNYATSAAQESIRNVILNAGCELGVWKYVSLQCAGQSVAHTNTVKTATGTSEFDTKQYHLLTGIKLHISDRAHMEFNYRKLIYRDENIESNDYDIDFVELMLTLGANRKIGKQRNSSSGN